MCGLKRFMSEAKSPLLNHGPLQESHFEESFGTVPVTADTMGDWHNDCTFINSGCKVTISLGQPKRKAEKRGIDAAFAPGPVYP